VNSIIMRDLKTTVTNNILTKAELQGNGVAIVTATGMPHSPTPVIDKLGEVRGLWMSVLVTCTSRPG
jgi:hypothetical protein